MCFCSKPFQDYVYPMCDLDSIFSHELVVMSNWKLNLVVRCTAVLDISRCQHIYGLGKSNFLTCIIIIEAECCLLSEVTGGFYFSQLYSCVGMAQKRNEVEPTSRPKSWISSIDGTVMKTIAGRLQRPPPLPGKWCCWYLQ